MAVVNVILPMSGGVSSLLDGILTVTAAIGDFLTGINKAAKEGRVFQHISEGIATVLGFVSSAIQGFFGLLSKTFSFPGLEGFQKILQNIQTRIGQVIDAVTGLRSGTRKAAGEMDSAMEGSKFLQMFQAIFNGAKTLVTGILDVFGGLASGIVEALSGADFSGALDLLISISLGGIAFGITKFTTSLTKAFDDVGGLLDNVKNILDEVGCFEAYQSQLKADALLKIASAIAILAGSILIIATIDSNKLTASLGAISVLFAELMIAMGAFTKISGQIKGVIKGTTAMLGLSTSMLILAGAPKMIAT